MKNKFNKIFKYAFLFIISCSLLLILSNHNAYADTANIYYVSASAGETYETVGINYHCNNEGSYVIYGTDKNLVDFEKVMPIESVFSIEQSSTDSSTGFASRFVCKAELTNLKQNTKYYYRIISGTEKSKIRSFTTAKQESGKHDILFLADTQSANLSSFQRANKVIEMLKSKSTKPELALIAGDIVDRGGYEAQWNAYFNGVTAFDDMLLTTVPGNHEYYHDNKPGYIDPSYYNQFFNNPQNGPEGRRNSSYFVKHDNVLIIMLDIINREYIEEHKAWFREVCEQNPSQWIIVMSHAGAISAGVYSGDASFVAKNFKPLFEEYQVDLALSGHEHIYIRKDLEYKGSKDEKLGVTYLVGPAAGGKQYQAQNPELFDEVIGVNQNYSGNILRFDGDTLTVDYYKEDGTKGTSFTLHAKRVAKVESISNAEVEESIKFEFKPEENRIYTSWSDKLWRNATKVEITGSQNWSSPIMSSYSNSHIIKNVYDGAKYEFTLSITMNDGSVVSKSFSVDLGWDTKTFNITYNLDGGELPAGAPTSYPNKSGLDALPIPTRDKYVFKGWYDENGVKYKSIPADTRKDLELTAVWVRGNKDKTITYILNGGELPEGAPTTYEMFVGLESLPTPTKKGYIFKGWDKNGEIITSISDEEQGNLILTALWEADPNAKGCKKSSGELMISMLSVTSLFALVLRKKNR